LLDLVLTPQPHDMHGGKAKRRCIQLNLVDVRELETLQVRCALQDLQDGVKVFRPEVLGMLLVSVGCDTVEGETSQRERADLLQTSAINCQSRKWNGGRG
jgi:hypothetical protein